MAESFSKKRLTCKDLYGYLLTLSSDVLNGLYDHPFTCLAVFRGLPELGKHYVMRTLFTDVTIPESVAASWCKKEHKSLHETAIVKLTGLRIWEEKKEASNMDKAETASNTKQSKYEMNRYFQHNLRVGLCGGGKIEEEPLKAVEERHARDVTFLDSYSKERWECILYYMTGAQGVSNIGVSEDVARILITSGLLSFDEKECSTTITSSGFQFLLLDTSSQVWYFMVQYLNSKSGETLIQCLSFLFQTGFSVLGKDYSVKNLTEAQFNFLQLLREIGLAYQRKRTSKRYYPTRLAINLGTAVTESTGSLYQGQGYLVVETNYRVYAYTESQLQVALMSLFTDIKSRFPQFTVGTLSRESVQQALACGISASQIIDFLRTRAHPQMLASNPVIPPTISDQVKLWEMERDRLRYTDGVLYNQFLSQNDFEMLRKYAGEKKVLLWANNQKRLMVVSHAGHDDVRKFWKKNKPS